MYYYLNLLYLYSTLGFVLESTVYKISNSRRHSSIFYGPITMVYGFGIVILTVIHNLFLKHLKTTKLKKIIITYFTSVFILSIVEWLGGTILYALFKIDLWNYTNKLFHFGKYVCLELSLIWGLLGTIYLYKLKEFSDKVIALFSKKATISFIILNVIDLILVFINKFADW